MQLQPIILLSIISILAGIMVRHYDISRNGNAIVNPKKLKPLQVVYTILFAIPFCAFYLYVDSNLNP